VSDANAVIGRFTLDGGTSVLALAAWRRATGQDLHSFTSTPAALFADAAGGDYHLRADAPARDTALAPTDVTTDFDGKPRPSGPAADIGADEWGDAATPPTPPAPPAPPSPPAAADLIVSAVSNPPADVRRGTRFTITDTVTNRGGTVTAATQTRYYFSIDAVRSTPDRALDGRRSVPSLAPGAASTGDRLLHVPASMRRGTYFLLVCADYAGRVREASETNNCRAAATSVVVR
jgi:hypothetical protein